MADRPNPKTPVTTPEILDLDGFVEAPRVQIGGALYTIRTPAQLGVIPNKRAFRFGNRYDELVNLDEPTPEQERELSAALIEFCDIVLDAPVEIRSRLTEMQRVYVLNRFFDSARKMPAMLRRETEVDRPAADLSTGAKSSPDSSASTEATR